MSDAPTYRLRSLRVDHAARTVLDLTEIELHAGCVTAIVGANGSGKTTLMRVLAWLQQPTAGRVEFQGRTVSYRERELSALRQHVTLVAQSPLLFHRSVRANLDYGLRARGLTPDDRIETALEAVGLRGFAERPAWKLSGGEAQRVTIARALAIDPLVYLFDEPTANIDRQHVASIEAVIERLGAAGKTVILTTHNIEQAYRLSDAVISLAEGRVAPFPLINLLRGTTERRDGVTYFVSPPLRVEIPNAAQPRSIAIDPDNILVSSAALHSSARNSFPGRIVKVERDERGMVVTVDCGRQLVARITRHSYEELALNVGAAVFVTFKSSAIHLLDPERPA